MTSTLGRPLGPPRSGPPPTSASGAGPLPRSGASHPGRRRWRGPVTVTLVVLLAAAASLFLLPGPAGYLDPDDAAPRGSRALSHLLADHGVQVQVRHSFDDVRRDLQASPGSTLLIARPDRLAVGRGTDVAALTAQTRSDLLVVGADNGLLADLGLPFGASQDDRQRVVGPACTADLPTRAGSLTLGGLSYQTTPEAGQGDAGVTGSTSCYPVADRYGYVEIGDHHGRRTILLGSGHPLTNDRLADAGNAALTVGALGAHPVLVWWVPHPLDGAPSDDPPTLAELLPDGIRYAVLQLFVVLLVVMLWRGRRLGRLVPEPLPVLVRAIETTLGRGQLYQQARARGRAAQVLRAATVSRLAVRCGLPRTAAVDAVVAAVATATGRADLDVAALLIGPDPADDTALVLLARQLDTLEGEVHRP